MTSETIKHVVWKRNVPRVLDAEDRYECIRCVGVFDADEIVYRDSSWENGWECKRCLDNDDGAGAKWLTPRAAVEAYGGLAANDDQ